MLLLQIFFWKWSDMTEKWPGDFFQHDESTNLGSLSQALRMGNVLTFVAMDCNGDPQGAISFKLKYSSQYPPYIHICDLATSPNNKRGNKDAISGTGKALIFSVLQLFFSVFPDSLEARVLHLESSLGADKYYRQTIKMEPCTERHFAFNKTPALNFMRRVIAEQQQASKQAS